MKQVPLVTRDNAIRPGRLVTFGQNRPMRTTVGGRPQRDGGSGGGAARGIDVLLLKGSVDAAFRAELSRDFSTAAESIGLDLTAAERGILASIPGESLAAMSERLRVPNRHRPAFLGRTAAAEAGEADVVPLHQPGGERAALVGSRSHRHRRNRPPARGSLFGLAPEWNERTHDCESEDEAR